jgi:hypothetical protein
MLFKARKALTGKTRKEVQPPSPHAQEITRWKGWTVFRCFDVHGKGRDTHIAIHEDTGEERDFDVSGYRIVKHHYQLFRDLIDLGFPTRSAVNGMSPLSAGDVERLKEQRAAA